LPTLRLEGLDAVSAGRLLTDETGTATGGAVLDRLLTQTGGNALALLELSSALSPAQLAGDEPLPADLPVTRQIERVFLDRVRRLSPAAQTLLLIAAADDSESAAIVRRAAGEDGSLATDEAEQAGLVLVEGMRVSFRHPLVRSAIYGAATSTERREAHSALADALADDEDQVDRRAWHVAAAAVEPDESVAAALDSAAERAERRAAFGAAMRALERAAELSPHAPERGRRLVGATRCASVAGADAKAASLAREAQVHAHDRGPLEEAEIAQALGRAEIRRGTPANAAEVLLAAASKVSSLDPERSLELLLDAAWAAQEAGERETHRTIGLLAVRLADSVGDDRSTFVVVLLSGLGALPDGDTKGALERLSRAAELGADLSEPACVVWAGSASMFLGNEEEAGRLFARAAELSRAQGTLGALASALGTLSVQKFVAQRFDQAVAAASEADQFARDVGAENLTAFSLFTLAAVAAIRGDDAEAIRRAEASFELARVHDLPVAAARSNWALALLDLGRGRWEDALVRFEALAEARLGLAGGIVTRALPDRIEAAVRANRPDAARTALDAFEGWAAHARMPWVQPRLASCRALVAEGEEATSEFEQALQLSGQALPFDRARIQLLYGEHLRRERRRSDSRVQLRAAVDAFAAQGAAPWEERARAELRASGETARRRGDQARDQLTPQELHIARLVGSGLSNKEIAANLYLSPRTIDSHLRNVFAKLGISSRTQLARLELEDDVVDDVA
jgi:DNA-binding CsgD family transcriptional regulator